MQKIFTPFTGSLPALEAIIDAVFEKQKLNLDRVAFVCVQHLLYTTFTLLQSLTRLGAIASNIHIIGKSYSSSPLVVKKLIDDGYSYYPSTSQEHLGCFYQYLKKDIDHMWQVISEDLETKKIEKIIILDDGGNCLTSVPQKIMDGYPIIGVEQTSSGLTNTRMHSLPFPIIEVAGSAAKHFIESPMIADAVVKKLDHILPITKKRFSCGVAGLGPIGRAVAKKLLSLGHQVMTYDNRSERNKPLKGIRRASNLETIFHETNYIFGCSGKDITENLDISSITKDKVFISCSSQDNEFQSLLKKIQQHSSGDYNVHNNVYFSFNNGNTINVFRGGFPVNFDNSGESVEALDIQLTRGLLLGGIIQALLSFSDINSQQECMQHALHPDIQAFVVSHWMPYGSTHLFNAKLLHHFQNRQWIKEHSSGVYQRNKKITECFQSPIAVRIAA